MFKTGRVRFIEKRHKTARHDEWYSLFSPQFEVKIWFMKPFWVYYRQRYLGARNGAYYYFNTLKECEEWIRNETVNIVIHEYNGKVNR